jgi:hypothetical protein
MAPLEYPLETISAVTDFHVYSSLSRITTSPLHIEEISGRIQRTEEAIGKSPAPIRRSDPFLFSSPPLSSPGEQFQFRYRSGPRSITMRSRSMSRDTACQTEIEAVCSNGPSLMVRLQPAFAET